MIHDLNGLSNSKLIQAMGGQCCYINSCSTMV